MTSGEILGHLLKYSFIYRRIDYDEREIRFLEGGKIGLGAASAEVCWELTFGEGAASLSLFGAEGELTCALVRSSDGRWIGRWERFERMSIELVPLIRTLVIQQASGCCSRLIELTAAHHLRYCRKHYMEIWIIGAEVQNDRHPYWTKIFLLRKALKMGYEFIVWLDADTLITNPAVSLREAAHEFDNVGMCKHLYPWKSLDWHFNAGVIFVKKTRISKRMFNYVWRAGPSDTPWEDQERIMEYVEKYPNDVSQIDNRWNAHPYSISESPVIRGWHGYAGDRIAAVEKALVDVQRIYPRGVE